MNALNVRFWAFLLMALASAFVYTSVVSSAGTATSMLFLF